MCRARDAGFVRPLAHLVVHLGRQDHLVAALAALGEPAPDDLLGDAFTEFPAVDVGGVEEIDPQLEGFVHDLVAVLFGRERAEVHRAQAECADF